MAAWQWIFAILLAALGAPGPMAWAQGADAPTQPVSAPASTPAASTAPAVVGEPGAAPAPSPAAAPAPTPATAPAVTEAPAPAPAGVRFQFENENLRDLVRFAGRMLNKPIMGEVNQVQGTFTYFDAKPYTPVEALGIINMVLRQNSFTLMESADGRKLDLLPLAELPKHSDVPIIHGNLDEPRLPDQEIVTIVVPLQYIDPGQAVTAVARMVHSWGTLATMGKTKGLIITDTVANIRRLQRIIALLDVRTLTEAQLQYYQLKYASATEVATLVERLFGASTRTARRFQFNPEQQRYEPVPQDPAETVTVTAHVPSNTVVVVASQDKQLMIKEMIEKLDVEKNVTGPGSSVRLFKLKSARADEVAKTLTQAIGTKLTPNIPGQPPQPPAARIVGDAGSNTLIVSAAPDVMKQIEELLKEIDDAKTTPTGNMRVFRLKVANAASIVPALMNAFRRDARGGQPGVNFAASADTRTNSLIVTGAAADIEGVAKLVEELDKELPADQRAREIHVYHVKAGGAREVAAALQKIFSDKRTAAGPGQPAEPLIKVEAEPATNSIIIAAAPGDWTEIKGVLEQMDTAAPLTTASQRIFQLKNGRASDLAATLSRVFEQRPRQARSPSEPAPVPVLILPDSGSNSLVVSASGDDLKKIEGMLTSLDVAPGTLADVQVRTYTLTSANAAQLARELERVFAAQQPAGAGARTPGSVTTPQPKFAGEPNSNQLIVSATVEQLKTIETLIKSFQGEEEKIASIVKPFPLKNAKAEAVAESIRRIVEADVNAKNQRRGPGPARRVDWNVSADARTNTVIVSAPSETVAVVEKLITTLDAKDSEVAQTTKVVELKNADAAELATALNSALAGQAPAGGRGGAARQIDMSGLSGRRVIAVPQTSANTLLLTGTEQDIAFAETLIKQIDARPSSVTVTTKTFKLTHGRAEDLARVLSETVAQTRAPRAPGRPDVPTKISADRNANAVVVAGAGDMVERVGELITQLDVEGAASSAKTTELVKLDNAKADSVAAAINAAQTGPRQPTRAGQQPDDDLVRAAADLASNCVLLTGRPPQLAETKKLIAEMDKSAAATATVTELVQLENADATEVAAALNNALAGRDAPSAGGRKPAVDLAALSGKKVLAVAAQTSRAVLLSGAKDDIAFAAELVKKLDSRPASDKAVVKTIALKYAQADALAKVLSDTIAQTVRAAGPGRPQPVPARISAERSSNSLVVSAGADVVEKVEELVKQLDVEGAGSGAITVEVVKLKKAKADQLATALNAAQGGSRSGSARAPAATTEDVVTVTADAQSNSLLLTGRAARIAETKKLIETLDSTSGELAGTMRTFPLQRAIAADVAAVLKTMLTDSAGPQRRPGAPVADIRVAAMDKANAVVVQAPPEAMTLAEQIVKEFDNERAAEVTVQIVPLAKADAVSLAKAVNDALTDPAPRTGPGAGKPAPEALVVAEGNSNCVLVRGNKPQVEKAVALIKQLDQDGTGGGATQLRTFILQHAESGKVAKTLDALFKQILAQQQRRTGPGAPPPTAFSITGDERTNTLVVSTSETNFAILEPLIKQLDTAEGVTQRQINYITLVNADAADLASKIDSMFVDRSKVDKPTVQSDTYSNSLTVIARDADYREIERVVKKWDEESAANAMRVKVLPLLPGLRAEKMAEMLRRVYPQVSGTEVKVNEAPAPSDEDSIIMPGPPDVGSTGVSPVSFAATGARISPLFSTTAPASALTTSSAPTTRRFGDTGETPVVPELPKRQPVVISVDPRTNSLIVSGSRSDLDSIESLISELSGNASAAEAELKLFRLKVSDPTSIARTLDALFNPRGLAMPVAVPQPGGRGQPAAQPQAAKPTVTIAADVRTRSVLVRAKAMELELIEVIIKQLDQEAITKADVRIFTLKNTDATEVATNLRQLFASSTGQQPGAAGIPNVPGMNASTAQQLQRQMIQLNRQGTSMQADPSSGTVTVSANRMTNSVIVAAPADAMELVAKLIEEIDQSPAVGATSVRMFKLEHAEVQEVVDAVRSIFTQGRSALGGGAAGARGTGGASASSGALVTGNEARRMVIVSARGDDMPLIEQVIKELDAAGEGVGGVLVKVYRLVNGDARSVADALTRTLTDATGAAAGGGGGARTGRPSGGGSAGSMRINPDTSGNALVVRATLAEHERIAELLKELDQVSSQQPAFKTIALARSDATEVAAVLNTMLRSWPGGRNAVRPAVAADRTSNTVTISATQADLDKITKMVEELEAGKKEKAQVQVIALQYGRAGEVAVALQAFFGPKAAGANPGDKTITVAADDRSNTLLVSARPEQMPEVLALVSKLDTGEGGGEPKRAVIALQYAQADAVAKALTAAFAAPGGGAGPRGAGRPVSAADAVTAAAEPGTNSVIVSATDKNLTAIRDLVKQLDQQTTGGRTTDMVALTNARAVDVAKVLAQVSVRKGPGAAAADAPTVSAEPTANVVVIAGKKADIEPLIAMAKQLDTAAVGKLAEPKILPLKNGDAILTANMVNQLMTQMNNAARAGGKTPEPVAVVASPQANAVVVSGSEEQVKTVEKLVNQIDEMGPGRANVRILQLKYGNPDDVMKALRQIYGSGADAQVTRPPARPPTGGAGRAPSGAGVGPQGSGPQVSVLQEQKALLINASDQDWEMIQKLVAELDKAAEGLKREVKIFALTKAANTQIAATLTNTYRAAQRTGRPEDVVTAMALQGTNAVVVTAVKEKMEEIDALVKQLDSVEIASTAMSKLYPLKNAMAGKIVPVLRQMIIPLQQQRPTQPITITTDDRTNTIIVSTQAPVWDDIAKIIETLDTTPPFKDATVIIVPLKNADAPSLAAVLSDILTPGTSKVFTPEAKALQEQVRLLRLQKGKEALAPLDLSKPIKITSDPAQAGQSGSNSLIISSTAENLAVLQEVVEMLDVMAVAKGAGVQIIHLSNARAANVVTIVREVFTQGKQFGARPAAGGGGAARKPDNPSGIALTDQLNISADATTNTVILAGTKESLDLAIVLVKDLDRQPTSDFTEVKLFALANGDAVKIAPLIRQVLTEQPAGVGAAAGPQTMFSRLRVLREKEVPVLSEVARTHPTLTVQAEANANVLIVAARSDLMPVIAEMVKTLDVPGAGSMNVIRICSLKEADATRLNTVIAGLYSGPNAALIRPEDRPTITVDTRTNSLIVTGSEKTLATIEALLAKLDAKLSVDLRDIRLVKLENADAATLTPNLQRMMDSRVQRQQTLGLKDAESLRVTITADTRSNCLIVSGSAEGFKIVEDLAKQLDSAPAALSGQIQLIPLTQANSAVIAATLGNLFNQRYAAVRDPNLQRQKPIILSDLRTNSLLVAANQDDSKILESLVGKLDLRITNPLMELVVLPLKWNDAGAIAPALQKIMDAQAAARLQPGQPAVPQDKVTLSTDGLLNGLIVLASKENLEQIRELVAKLDIEPPSDTGVVRLFPLRYADAQRVSGMLRTLIQGGLYKPALIGAQNNPIAQAREKVSMTVDLRTNSLIISASKENFAVIEQILEKVDAKDTWGLVGNIKLYTLQFADATRMGTMLQQMFDRKLAAENSTGGGVRALPVVVTIDERTNSLLVAGGQEAFEAVDTLLAKLDVKDVLQTTDFRVLYLKKGSATAVASSIKQMFQSRVARGRTPTPLTVIADPRLNSVILAGDRDDLALAEQMVEKLDGIPAGANQVMRLFPLAKADAAAMVKTLQAMYAAQKPTGGDSGVVINADERTNTLIVAAGPSDMEAVADLVAKLDAESRSDITEIRIFPLRYADAAQLATVLTDALTNKPKPLTPISPLRATVLRFVAEAPDGKKLMETAFKEGIMITAVIKTNSLLVQAPLDTIPLLSRLIESLDNPIPTLAEIRVFTLTNADATQMARILTELFRLAAPAANRPVARVSVNNGSTSQPAENGGSSAMFGALDQLVMTITVDKRTNSLLVCGTKDYLELVDRVIKGLDASPAEDRQTLVYRMKAAQATDVATALKSFLDQERLKLVQILGADAVGAAKEMLAQEIAIQAEKVSNTLLISSSPRYFKSIMEMVKQLDQTPPQVLIQVLLAEVTLDDTTEFGIDWNLTAHHGDSFSAKVGTNFGVGAKTDGFNFSLSSGDINLMLRALQAQGRLEVLQRPQLLAADNQPAKINVGSQVPFITNARILDTGGTVSTIEYRPVGIILNVTPNISPDGYVKLLVAPEVSSISTSSVKISDTVNAAILDSRSAQTTVLVQDGHTVVIGGLITSKDETREDKVPVLGDIPLVGLLFKSTLIVRKRTELLIVLTPRVLRNPTEADILTNQQIRQQNLSRGLYPDTSIGELINPLRNVSPVEIERLEKGRGGDKHEVGFTVIPLKAPRTGTQTTTTEPAE